MSRKWIIGVGVVCLLIAVVSVALYFVPSLQVAFKETPSRKQDLDMRKQVVKDDVAGRRAKEKSDGENPVSMYRLCKNNTLMVGARGVKMFKNRMGLKLNEKYNIKIMNTTISPLPKSFLPTLVKSLVPKQRVSLVARERTVRLQLWSFQKMVGFKLLKLISSLFFPYTLFTNALCSLINIIQKINIQLSPCRETPGFEILRISLFKFPRTFASLHPFLDGILVSPSI